MAKMKRYKIRLQSNRTGEIFEGSPIGHNAMDAYRYVLNLIKEGFDEDEDPMLQLDCLEEDKSMKIKLDAEMQGKYLNVLADTQTENNKLVDEFLTHEDEDITDKFQGLLYEQYLIGRTEASVQSGEVTEEELELLTGWEEMLEDANRIKTMSVCVVPIGESKKYTTEELAKIEEKIDNLLFEHKLEVEAMIVLAE